ncbi:hypothetical protein [Streptomyces achromogenes]|uniref:hypothetical protein n=1 Tax=Streptomyces achromogenes TaxID=67255 RepID=UPI0036F5A0B8
MPERAVGYRPAGSGPRRSPVTAAGTTAREAAGVYVAACDPEAAVNASTWRETEAAHRAVRTALLSHTWADGSVPQVLRRLAGDPADATAHRHAEAALTAELARDGAFAARLTELLAEVTRTSVVRYHLGADYRQPTPDEPPAPRTPEEVLAVLADDPAVRPAPRTGAGDPLLAVVVPVRAHPSDTGRARNAVAAVASAMRQDLDRSAYRVVVVEQDVRPRMDKYLSGLVDEYLFLPNPGASTRAGR